MSPFDLSPFHAALDEGKLALPRSARSGRWLAPGETSEDGVLLDDVTWERIPGHGVIDSYVVYRRSYRVDLEVPYCIAMIRLDEGPRLLARLIGVNLDHVPTALRVTLASCAPLLSFRPAG